MDAPAGRVANSGSTTRHTGDMAVLLQSAAAESGSGSTTAVVAELGADPRDRILVWNASMDPSVLLIGAITPTVRN